MSATNDDVGTFVVVVGIMGVDASFRVVYSEYERIETAYRGWYERRADSVLELLGMDGDAITIAGSRIDSYWISSPIGRERAHAIQVAINAEHGTP